MHFRPELKGFLPFSLIDWPGKVSAVLFFAGCNFACPTCHNFELAKGGHNLPSLSWIDVYKKLKDKKKWLDGVVLTGGEVTLLSYLSEMCGELKQLGYQVKIDSNGFLPEVIEDLVQRDRVDLFAIDVKGPWDKYALLTGKNIEPKDIATKMKKIFSLAQKYPNKFLFRLTKVPFLTPEDIEVTKSYLPKGFALVLQEYKEPQLKA
ncbi:MAG: anaerobic ribonucleoside-triphosphate reductase activating protein [Desulfonauticus sp.]|nr:anaerobic ribonucleoside-triphosphate reductase activating protein [Desulfonauticus sp.]